MDELISDGILKDEQYMSFRPTSSLFFFFFLFLFSGH